MVRRSTEDWEEHKRDVFEIIKGRYGEDRATKFIEFYKSRYDKYGRTFLDYKLAYWLFDDYHYVKRVGTKWYAFVGVGGTGKTTTAINVFHFLDNNFELNKSLCFDIHSFVKSLKAFETIGSMKSCYLDEPDDLASYASKEGKYLRKICGKARQQKLFLGICATDLKDIPPYIYRKLDGIFFFPCLGKFMFFKNRPKKLSYVIQEIRDNYTKMGYKTFFVLKRHTGCLRGNCISKTHFTKEELDSYLNKKKKDYEKDIDTMLKILKVKNVGAPKEDERIKVILNMRKEGMKYAQIGKYFGLSGERIGQLVDKFKNQTANEI